MVILPAPKSHTSRYKINVVFRFVLFYYGTGQSGWSRKGGSDLVVMNEVALAKHKTRETKRKDLKKAIEEAEKDIKTK